jgi:hypothetical protein
VEGSEAEGGAQQGVGEGVGEGEGEGGRGGNGSLLLTGAVSSLGAGTDSEMSNFYYYLCLCPRMMTFYREPAYPLGRVMTFENVKFRVSHFKFQMSAHGDFL